MMLGTPTTLLVVTRDRVIRAEFKSASATAPSSLVVRDRPETDDPVVAVVAAMGHDRRAPGRTFVLSADLWTRTLTMPTANAAAMSTEELQQALAFEAEPLSGQSPAETTTACVALDDASGTRTLWVTQTPSHTLTEIDEVVRGARGKLLGVLHPAGVPYSIRDSDAAQPWSRVEFWPDVAVRLAGGDGRATTGRIDEARVANRSAVVEDWSKKTASAEPEVWWPEFRASPEPTWLSAADEGTLARWLTAWNRALAARHSAFPLLRPAKRPLSGKQRQSIATSLAAVALLACFGHGYWVGREIESTKAEQARLEAPGKELASLRKQVADNEKKLKDAEGALTVRTAEVEGTERTLDAHRRRLGLLLERLARNSSPHWVLRSIEGDAAEIVLHGATMHPEHVITMAASMAESLAELGWTVDPPEQQAKNVRPDGGPWQFTLRLRDASLPNATPAEPKTPNAANVVRTPEK